METLSIEWEHEDELPEMSDSEYSLMYLQSEIIFGVRMFPFVIIYTDGEHEGRRAYLSGNRTPLVKTFPKKIYDSILKSIEHLEE